MFSKYNPSNEEASQNLILSFTKKAGKKALKHGKKALKKSILIIIKSIGIPATIVIGIVVVLSIIASYVFYGERGSTSEYNTDTYNTNQYEYSENSENYLVPVASEISSDNELVELYYKFMSIQSYYKTINGGRTLLSFSKNTDSFSKYIDYYGKENIFYLNNYFLLSLDEIAHEHKFRYPEQFIKPVYADINSRKLMNLLDEDGNLSAMSTQYKNNIPTENKEVGVWDYGFAPILYYKEYEKEDFVKGVYTKKDIQVGNNVITITIDEPFRVPIKNTKKDIYVIEDAVTQSGNIKYNYEQQDVYLRDLKEGITEDESAEYTKYLYDYAYIEIMTQYGPTTIEVPLYKYRTGTVVEYIPVEISSDEDLQGIEYLENYLENYEAYIPDGVMEDFDFNDRVAEQEKLINELSILNAFAGGRRRTTTQMGNINTGSKVLTDPYENSLQYLSLFEKYGNQFGIDPYLLVAMASQESAGQHDRYCNDRGAVGLMQIEPPKSFSSTDAAGNKISINVDREDLFNVETNIKTGTAYLKSCIDYFNGNILMGVQGYNFGPTGIRTLVKKYAEDNGKTYEEVRDNHGDLGWMSYRGQYTNGGDKIYIEHVLAYYSNSLDNLTGVELAKETEDFDPTDVVENIAKDNSQKGWLEKAWSNITEGFNNLFASINSFFTVSYADTCFQHKNNMGDIDIESIISQTLAFSNYSNYYSSYDDVVAIMSSDSESGNFLFLGSVNYFGGIGGGTEFIEGIAAELEGFINPTERKYRITSHFGLREDPIRGGTAFHNGTDYATPEGTPLYAVADGIILYANHKKSYGNIVELKSDNFNIKYAHMSKIIVDKGEHVVKGQLIGYSGNTGDSTGPHLHFEVLFNGKRINPHLYFY